MTEAISPNAFLYTYPTVHPSVSIFITDCTVSTLWNEMKRFYTAADYPQDAYQNHEAMLFSRIVQIVNLLEGYLPRKGACGALITLLHLIWNAVKAFFGCSDLQKACALFKNVIEESKRFRLSHDTLVSDYIKFNLEHSQPTDEMRQLLQNTVSTEEAVEIIVNQVIQEHLHLSEAESIENAQLICLKLLTTEPIVLEYCASMPAAEQEELLQTHDTALHKLNRVGGPILDINLIYIMNNLLATFSESSPADLMQLVNCPLWQNYETLNRPHLDLMVMGIQRIADTAPEDVPLYDNPEIHALFSHLDTKTDEILYALKEILYQGRLETVQELMSLFYRFYAHCNILPHLSHFLQMSDDDESPIPDRAALTQKIAAATLTFPAKLLESMTSLHARHTALEHRMTNIEPIKTTIDRYFFSYAQTSST